MNVLHEAIRRIVPALGGGSGGGGGSGNGNGRGRRSARGTGSTGGTGGSGGGDDHEGKGGNQQGQAELPLRNAFKMSVYLLFSAAFPSEECYASAKQVRARCCSLFVLHTLQQQYHVISYVELGCEEDGQRATRPQESRFRWGVLHVCCRFFVENVPPAVYPGIYIIYIYNMIYTAVYHTYRTYKCILYVWIRRRTSYIQQRTGYCMYMYNMLITAVSTHCCCMCVFALDICSESHSNDT